MAERVEEAVNFIESINVKEEERKFKSMQIQKTKDKKKQKSCKLSMKINNQQDSPFKRQKPQYSYMNQF
jgi:hypothetical protein